MARKLLGSATTAVALAADAVRHVVWYVSHQVNGRPREDRRDGDES